MNQDNSYIFVIGNEKGGAGKTTCTMHLIAALLDKGYSVASIDVDTRQRSLTTYLENRKKYNDDNPERPVAMPVHFTLQESQNRSIDNKDEEEKSLFEDVLSQARKAAKYIVIDTPGSHTYLSRLAHSYADTVITPINDSFLDIDVMAKIGGEKIDISGPSIYSQMLWEQKMERASRDRGSIDWVVVRNRLSNLDAINKRKVTEALEKIAKRIPFRIAPGGFGERVIFRELYPCGLTLLDLTKANYSKSLSVSHVAARQELRDFVNFLGIE